MRRKFLKLSCGLLATAACCVSAQAAVVFTDTFDHPGNSAADFTAAGWTAVYGTAGGNFGTGTSGNANATESVLWGNPTADGNTEAALEYNYMTAPIACGDILTIDVNCMRFEGYSYLREIILWDGANPATRESVAVLNGVGRALGPYATWWTPPAKDRIESLSYVATSANAGKYVIFKYGHSAGWGETADVTFSVTKVTAPVFTAQPPAGIVRTEGESAAMSAAAIGCNVTYQWKKDGTPLVGRTDAVLELFGLTTGDSGNYMVTATTPSGSTDSTVCVLAVQAKQGGGASLSAGVSFSHNYGGTPFAPAVTAIAYGVPGSRWQVAPTTATGMEYYNIGGGQMGVIWSANNTYWVGGLPTDLNPGNEQVNFAYLDDGGAGYSVQLSGLKSGVGFKEYVVKAIGASDSATNFNSVTVTDDLTGTTQALSYGPLTLAREGYAGKASVSTTSGVLTNDSVTLSSTRLESTLTRGCLAGVIVTDKPAVLTQPQAPLDVVFNGEAFALTGEAFGVPPLSYQWRKDGMPISGATTTSFSKTGAVVADSGVYDLLVTNVYGTATSLSATVTVVSFIQPTVIQQPVSKTVYAGRSVFFTALGYGGQLSYQWNKDGAPLSGKTDTTLTLTGVTASDQGNYTVTITNPAGTTNSQPASLTVLPVPTTGYISKILADNPVSYWRLNETAGTTLADSWGVNFGTYVGGVGLGQPGAIMGDTAVSFTNSGWVLATPSTYADVPYTAELNPSGAFSVEFWVKVSSIPNDLFSPLSSLNVNAGRSGYLFYLNGGSGWQFRLGNTSGTTYIATVGGGSSSTDWQHIVGVYDGANQAYLYVNGVQFGPVTLSGAYTPNAAVPLRIGAPTGFSRPWNGLVDDVAFYNYALTPTQIANHMKAGVQVRVGIAPVQSIVQNTKPASPVHGENLGATWVASDSGRSGVMKFDATNANQIVVNAYPQLNSTSGTIAFWVRLNEFAGSGSESAMVMDWRSSGGSGRGTIIAINDGQYAPAGTVFFQANPSGANPFSSVGTVNDGQWHHVAVTYGQSAGQAVSIYIDGAWNSSQANVQNWSWPTDLPVLLGRSRDGYWKKLHGSLDDVRFYNRALSDSEITQVVAGSVVDDNSLVLRFNFDSAPVSGYRLTSSPTGLAVEASPTVNTGYSPVGTSPSLVIPSGPSQFFRAVMP